MSLPGGHVLFSVVSFLFLEICFAHLVIVASDTLGIPSVFFPRYYQPTHLRYCLGCLTSVSTRVFLARAERIRRLPTCCVCVVVSYFRFLLSLPILRRPATITTIS